MRAVLFQHFISVIQGKFRDMMRTASSRSTAENLGWLSPCGKEVYGIRWDSAQQRPRHVRDTSVPSLAPQEIEQMLEELLVVATKPLVIHRFHAARRLASEYQSPVLGLFLEVGMRTTEAQTVWKLLHRMARSSTWATGGCFLRNERMQMSALAKRLSTLTV